MSFLGVTGTAFWSADRHRLLPDLIVSTALFSHVIATSWPVVVLAIAGALLSTFTFAKLAASRWDDSAAKLAALAVKAPDRAGRVKLAVIALAPSRRAAARREGRPRPRRRVADAHARRRSHQGDRPDPSEIAAKLRETSP